jgi:hypothetical protein
MPRKKTRNYDDWTTVAVKKETRRKILKLGVAGDTFDAVLKKMLRLIK